MRSRNGDSVADQRRFYDSVRLRSAVPPLPWRNANVAELGTLQRARGGKSPLFFLGEPRRLAPGEIRTQFQ